MIIRISLLEAVKGEEYRFLLERSEGIVAIFKVDSCSLNTLGKLWGLEASGCFCAELQASEERIVDCCLVCMNFLWPGCHQDYQKIIIEK